MEQVGDRERGIGMISRAEAWLGYACFVEWMRSEGGAQVAMGVLYRRLGVVSMVVWRA